MTDLRKAMEARLEELRKGKDQVVQQVIAHNAAIAELEKLLKESEEAPKPLKQVK